mmetsp:Transcript_27331/g.73998  ORF Transcript_27331/g.73998 Transcript_27331/m.73998 type:complete len:260 (+) Transcript_27331:278-1057(+)
MLYRSASSSSACSTYTLEPMPHPARRASTLGQPLTPSSASTGRSNTSRNTIFQSFEKSRASPAGSARLGLLSSRSSFNRRNFRISVGSEVTALFAKESRRRLTMSVTGRGNSVKELRSSVSSSRLVMPLISAGSSLSLFPPNSNRRSCGIWPSSGQTEVSSLPSIARTWRESSCCTCAGTSVRLLFDSQSSVRCCMLNTNSGIVRKHTSSSVVLVTLVDRSRRCERTDASNLRSTLTSAVSAGLRCGRKTFEAAMLLVA